MRLTIGLVPALALLAALSACSVVPRTPLAKAAAAGNEAEVRRLLAEGQDPDAAVTGWQLTPLAFAARGENTGVVAALLDGGADPALGSGVNGWTPLVHAVHVGRDAAAALLLERCPPAPETRAETLRMAAGNGNVAIVRALLAGGARPIRLALTGAVGGAWDLDAHWNGCGPHTEIVRAMIAARPDITVPDTLDGRMALRFARKKGCTEMLSLLDGARRRAEGRPDPPEPPQAAR